jgi:SAM-dependent methyltransferase
MFPKRIRSISHDAKVLDIGPGNSPHPRADVLLEKRFENLEEAYQQRGKTGGLVTNKRVVYFDGVEFPFADKEFDYIICSHVLEHVPDVEQFMKEVFRVGKAGYFEFPSIYYEYLYNFNVHLQLLGYANGELRFIRKRDSQLNVFRCVQKMLYRSLEQEHVDLVNDLKHVMFIGFEWNKPFPVRKALDIGELTADQEMVVKPPPLKRYLRRLQRKMNL